jgi:30S ribosomal protein S31
MGKGDKKTKRGKIYRGTFGTRRPKIKKRRSAENKIAIGNKANVK